MMLFNRFEFPVTGNMQVYTQFNGRKYYCKGFFSCYIIEYNVRNLCLFIEWQFPLFTCLETDGGAFASSEEVLDRLSVPGIFNWFGCVLSIHGIEKPPRMTKNKTKISCG